MFTALRQAVALRDFADMYVLPNQISINNRGVANFHQQTTTAQKR